ncbi:MAG: hypothetical protein KDK60_04050, partial [Chlamydiia bacterium]|nr:hypothetical protein [Chlamydiia bacterium]
FQKSFQEYTQPNVEFHKKQQLQKVIEEALQVMNETACVALKKEKMGAEEQLNTDYQQVVKDPTQENQQKVSEDLKSLGD